MLSLTLAEHLYSEKSNNVSKLLKGRLSMTQLGDRKFKVLEMLSTEREVEEK